MPRTFGDDDEAILCGGGFTPLALSAVVGWLRVANATVTGSGVSSLPDVMNPGKEAVQSTDAARPPLGAAANGLPILTFSGAHWMAHPLDGAINNNAAYFGMGLWLRSPLNTVARTIYSIRGIAGGASASRVTQWQISNDETMLADVNTVASNARRIRTNAAQVLGDWEFWTLEHQGSLVGDARCIQRKNGVFPASTYSAIGVATEMPEVLITPTGNGFLGSTSTVPGSPMIGDMGPNIFFLNRQLTTDELSALMAFEAPS